VQQHVHLEKWILKFKVLYLLNHPSHFNKICRISCLELFLLPVPCRSAYVTYESHMDEQPEPCKNGWTEGDTVWGTELCQPKKLRIKGPTNERHLANKIERHCSAAMQAVATVTVTTHTHTHTHGEYVGLTGQWQVSWLVLPPGETVCCCCCCWFIILIRQFSLASLRSRMSSCNCCRCLLLTRRRSLSAIFSTHTHTAAS